MSQKAALVQQLCVQQIPSLLLQHCADQLPVCATVQNLVQEPPQRVPSILTLLPQSRAAPPPGTAMSQKPARDPLPPVLRMPSNL